jgi:hypothetical protein
MGMYDDILKQMQGSFMQNNPKMFGKPGGFNDNNNFGFNNPDVIKPGGGFGGGGTKGNPIDDGIITGGNAGGSTGGGYGSGGNNQSMGSTQYGGQFGSTFSGVDDVLSGVGQSGYNLFDPASQYGYGSEYSEYFDTFDVGGYNEAMDSLKLSEQRKMSDIGQQFQSRTQGMQSNLQDTLLGMIGKESTSGLVGGRAGQRRKLTRESGQQGLEQLGQQTQARYSGVQEQIGGQIGMLEGSLLDFINTQGNKALNLMQSGATKSEAGSESNQTWKNQPKGSPMSASQLTQYNIFGDLTNSSQAFQAFTQNAHSNLNVAQLNELAQSIYDQYQNEEESGNG